MRDRDFTWEIDVFEGRNAGLIVAEASFGTRSSLAAAIMGRPRNYLPGPLFQCESPPCVHFAAGSR